MNEQIDDACTDFDDWPVPSRDVLRELDGRSVAWLAWPEPGGAADAAPQHGSS